MIRTPNRNARLASLLIALALIAPTTAFAGEADRQLEFARSELDAGDFDRALKSSASALRLDPTLSEALLIKGLAYEGKGERVLAQALIMTYSDLAGPSVDEAATAALVRLSEPVELEASPTAIVSTLR